MSTVTFDAAAFRIQFPNQFADPPNTDAVLELYWNTAICYVDPRTSYLFDAVCLRQLLNFVTAHLLKIADAATLNKQAFRLESANIDKVTISVQAYPVTSQFQWFWNQTPYGMQAYVQMTTATAGGIFFSNGLNELQGFRRAGGVFSPPTAVVETIEDPTCPFITSAPQAPFDIDFGAIGGGNAQMEVPVETGCNIVTLEFDGVAPAAAVTISVWSGTSTDSGNRFDIYYWDSDERAAGSAPGAQATNFDPTGLTLGSGFNLSGILTGATANNPNLVALTGFLSSAEQVLFVDIAVA